LVGVHSKAALPWSGLTELMVAFTLRSVDNGLSLSRSTGYAKMVAMASEEIDDGHLIDRLLGEPRVLRI